MAFPQSIGSSLINRSSGSVTIQELGDLFDLIYQTVRQWTDNGI